jgi:hypothetical protein
MIRCPLCEYQDTRTNVHAHLIENHAEAVEMWSDASSGKRRYRITCPLCEAAHEAQVKPRSHDQQFLSTFSREIRMVAFDMLLNHFEAEHSALPAGEPAPPHSSLPAAGPGGGRGRPGTKGVPLPPGMDEPDLPPWARAAERLKVTHANQPGSKE